MARPERPAQALSGRRGFTLLETVIALAIAAIVLPALLVSIASVAGNSDHVYDRSVLFDLANSQMEDVQRQAWQNSPASYALIAAPSGYSLGVVTASAVTYTYPAPLSSSTAETLQLVPRSCRSCTSSSNRSGKPSRRKNWSFSTGCAS